MSSEKERSKEDIPVCRAKWSCWKRSIGDWWRSGRENWVPRSPFVLSFEAAEREGGSAFGETYSSWAANSILGLSRYLTQTIKARIRLWTWLARREHVCGRGWRWTERWRRRCWPFYLRGCSQAWQSALKDSFGGCRQFIRTSIMLVFILHFH